MNVPPEDHLSTEILLAWDRNLLADDAMVERILAHLESCSSCSDKVDNLPVDPLLEKLRAAKKGEVTSVPPQQPPNSAATPESMVVDASTGVGLPPLPTKLPEPPGFEIIRELGRGGMGVVHLALDRQLNRQVALKKMNLSSSQSEDGVARFLAEGKAVAALQHPNIVQIFGEGQWDNQPFLILEYVSGGDLEKQLKQKLPTPRTAARLVEQLAQGMNAAHQAGIVHRDLKPSNILLSPDGTPKITDFGMARRVEGGKNLTMSKDRVGTPKYMAPEQASGQGKHAGPAADVYALGAILYECLTGSPPFQASTILELFQQIVDKEPVPPRRLQPKVPHNLETISLKCLRKHPQQRYASAAALAEDLRRWQVGEPIQARPVGSMERGVKGMWRHRTRVSLIGFLALVILSVVGLFMVYPQQIRQAGEDGRRQAREEAEKERLQQKLETILIQNSQQREEILEKLADPKKIYELLNNFDRWKNPLEQRKQLLLHGNQLVAVNPDLISAKIKEHLAAAEKLLDADQRDWSIAKELDDARGEASLMAVGGKLDRPGMAKNYPKVFARWGWPIEKAGLDKLVSKLNESPIRHALVATLDDWANETQDEQLRELLLEITRKGDPDFWRDQFRDVNAWNNPTKLQELAKNMDLAQQSPRIVLSLVSQLFKYDKEAATALLRQARIMYPYDYWLQIELGLLTKNPEEAAGCYLAALAVRKDSVLGYAGLGEARFRQKNLADTILAYQNALLINPNQGMVCHNLGVAYYHQKELDNAIEAYNQAIKCSPPNASTYSGLGLALQSKGNISKAIEKYNKAIQIDPKFAEAHFNLGSALMEQQELDGAIKAFDQAITVNSEFAEAYNSKGTVLIKLKNVPGAIAAFTEATEINSKYALAFTNLGNAYHSKGNAFKEQKELSKAAIAYKKATETYKKATKIAPALANPHYALAIVLSQQGQFHEAHAAAKEALVLLPPGDPLHGTMLKLVKTCEEKLKPEM